MSVLAKRRSESKAEYINVAYQIYVGVIGFLSRMSARYGRIMTSHIADLAGQIQAHTEQANAIYPSDPQRVELRKAHLLEARASLMALDSALTLAYSVLRQNPQGAFTTAKGEKVPSKRALERLEKLAVNLGEMIDKENALLKGAIKICE